ncbi:MAG: ROK family protein [Blautia sp.]|uniref:ROK family protein n=1 Tax=Blautia sp. TaxID=1955243 RepID=UPI002A74E314|nr:ROK family protein [Blautia sp.]MDY3017569.1 ROK family protein [Blautia sp.]
MQTNKIFLGIDIGGTAAKIGLVNSDGDILEMDSFSVSFDGYQTPIIETVVKNTDIFLKRIGTSVENLSGIGVSATGQINVQEGTVAGSAGHIANWLGTPVKTILEEHYDLPVTVANDANCAVMGEQWKGAAKDSRNVIMITVGTGVGGGIIVQDQLLSGSVGIAGELGHFTIKKDGIPCSCGNTGCYESYASTTALVRRVKELSDTLSDTDIDGRYIFRQAAEGNQKILKILDEWIQDIAVGLIGLIHIFNPETVIIGGGVSQQEELFICPLKEKILKKVMPCFRENLHICAAELGNNAGLLGAVAFLKKHENLK